MHRARIAIYFESYKAVQEESCAALTDKSKVRYVNSNLVSIPPELILVPTAVSQ